MPSKECYYCIGIADDKQSRSLISDHEGRDEVRLIYAEALRILENLHLARGLHIKSRTIDSAESFDES